MTVHAAQSADVSLSLALAVVASSTAPLLLLDGHGRVIAVSLSFCKTFQVEPAPIPGRLIFELGNGEWDVPQLRSLLAATASGHAEIDAYEMDFTPKNEATRTLVVNARTLSYADAAEVRLLVTLSDVTEARLAESVRQNLAREMTEIKREKAMLLRELQHRVANSLQIIASVLMQTARRVQSDETRRHLHDAHHRVMSVAVLQKQLSVSTMDHVHLQSYFSDLCRSIGASMIRDHSRITLAADVDGSITTADVSVSLGLIVTELVINALKHAFPEDRGGKITVSYHSEGAGWRLMVADDGAGMPGTDQSAKSGLGTSIVNALAKQLRAHVTTCAAGPGTLVCVVHAAEPDGLIDTQIEPAA